MAENQQRRGEFVQISSRASTRFFAHSALMKLFTVGYEGRSIDEFTAFLKKKRIHLIADVRKNPVSRKKGFSKNKLAEALAQAGIEYVHFRELGMPIEWRRQAKGGTITRRQMFQRYVAKVLPQETAALRQVEDLLDTKPGVALLCYEADPTDCHRSDVARELKKRGGRGFEIVDLIFPIPKKMSLTEGML